jgi:hypothetical protein
MLHRKGGDVPPKGFRSSGDSSHDAADVRGTGAQARNGMKSRPRASAAAYDLCVVSVGRFFCEQWNELAGQTISDLFHQQWKGLAGH